LKSPLSNGHQPASDSYRREREACDILIIGGGPSGSTAAALLAEKGCDVVLLEKHEHPRFHIGESLLPRNLAIFERLGMMQDIARIGVLKPGAEFVSDETGCRTEFNFANGLDHDYSYAYQVKRAEFDQALFANAMKKGARTYERTAAIDLSYEKGSDRRVVTAKRSNGENLVFSARLVIDASGRDTFIAAKFGLKEANKRESTAAAFAHFRDVKYSDDKPSGHITVHLVRHGWFWMIPLLGGITSVGFVGDQHVFKLRRGNSQELFFSMVRDSPSVSACMADATLVFDVLATGNYSYCAKTSCGEGYLMIGDAFAFVDPIFSTGVMLAMASGETAVEIALQWLEDPQLGMALARKAERRTRNVLSRFKWFIDRINHPVFRDMFMAPSDRFKMRAGVVSLLSGNIRPSWRYSVPLMAFKCMFYALSAAYHFGVRLSPPVGSVVSPQ
jgi:flavin-dependent dehydrogenase